MFTISILSSDFDNKDSPILEKMKIGEESLSDFWNIISFFAGEIRIKEERVLNLEVVRQPNFMDLLLANHSMERR